MLRPFLLLVVNFMLFIIPNYYKIVKFIKRKLYSLFINNNSEGQIVKKKEKF